MDDAGFLGRGWRFPIRLLPAAKPGAGRSAATTTTMLEIEPQQPDRAPPKLLGLAWSEGADKIADSIWIILSTAPGERLMQPEFGCGIHELVFEPNLPQLLDLIADQVADALRRFEPRIDVVDVSVRDVDGAPNQLLIDVSYKILSNNQLYNLVYPFYLQEGAG